MTTQTTQTLAEGVECIDTGLYRPQLAASYLIRGGDRLAFVDTGVARALPRLLAAVEQQGLTPEHVEAVIPTHVHLDHAGAAGALMAVCPNARLIVHPKGAQHLIDPSKLTAGATAVYGAAEFERHFGDLTPIPESRVEIAEDEHRIDIGGRVLRFIDTPGHANHHGCLFDERTRGWFTGDTFGIAYPEFCTSAGPWLLAPTTPVAFDPPAWQASLDRLLEAKPLCAYLTHFGRVEDPAALVGQLRGSIDALAEVALREEDQPEAGRLARLKCAVTDTLVAAAQAHGVRMAPDQISEWLVVDRELNAQGLEVWLQRRRKQREAAA
ncbi:MBL fold metallo-hydrolase [Rhabdochromatium marinum]|uniref:MBL fold metallo-hydrolase n=1 Tax=Rhabdochromatium marinum TaxID=48729 RepID=UPI001906280C|nr:MBL fold metallo-hydrolase [Rhabdochromatium marinum]MBK1647069.1 MBL fold metallo-hydrolase [Rhabdochromatium marinum]